LRRLIRGAVARVDRVRRQRPKAFGGDCGQQRLLVAEMVVWRRLRHARTARHAAQAEGGRSFALQHRERRRNHRAAQIAVMVGLAPPAPPIRLHRGDTLMLTTFI
jgi:FtsP/CotA-like multicopper oxidase with cupredoxin domain